MRGSVQMSLFVEKLIDAIHSKKNPTVVGLDPRLDLLPEEILAKYVKDSGRQTSEMAGLAILEFNRRIIDVVAPVVPAVKPQVAFYEIFGAPGFDAYFKTIRYAQEKGLLVIGDVKRGDIGSTAEAYARGHLVEEKICGVSTGGGARADALTVNPYLGIDSIRPFIEACKKTDSGLFVLVKTSNPSSADFQNLTCEGRALYLKVAAKVVAWGEEMIGDRGFSSIGAVVGATHPETLAEVKQLFPSLFMLIPGYGAQGGTSEMIRAAFDRNGDGAIVNSSRGIIFAGRKGDESWEKAVERAALEMKESLCRTIGW
jgi:orotidine-5'-phosphate decarboxylase